MGQRASDPVGRELMRRRSFLQVGYSGLLGLGLPVAGRTREATSGWRDGGRSAFGDRHPFEWRPGTARFV